MKIISLFSGIGAFEKALDNLDIPYELVGFSEIDKYAIKSYTAIHNIPESMNLGDITKINEKTLPKDIDLLTYGFPCQDISICGYQKGLFAEGGVKTRSGLVFESLRIIEEVKPRVCIAENVKNLVSKKFSEQFKIVLMYLEAAGYNNYWKVLNAKDYGIPQNRERVFIISIRKDIDNGAFEFPKGFPLDIRLKDVLENEVDEKFYLSDKMMNYLFDITEKNKARGNGNVYVPTDPEGISKTITTKEGSRVKDNFIEEPCVMQIGNLMPSATRDNPNQGRLYDKNGIAPTLGAMQGGNRQPFVTVREATKKGYAEAYGGDSINLEQPNSAPSCGRVGKQVAQTLTTSCNQAVLVNEPQVLRQVRTEYGKEVRKAYESGEVQEKWGNMKRFEPKTDGVANTLTTVQKDNYVVEPINVSADGTCRTIKAQYYKNSIANFESKTGFGATGVRDGLRIRKLTPKECFRLMGFDDESFHKAEAVNSNTQLFKQAGNSITVTVLEHLLDALRRSGIL